MRVLLLHLFDKSEKKQAEVLRNLAKGAESKGNQVDVFDAAHDSPDNLHLGLYQYIAVAVAATQLFGAKTPPKLAEIFARGGVSGQKGCALVLKFGLSSGKLCSLVMAELERQGLMLDYSDIIESAEHAEAVGKKIG